MTPRQLRRHIKRLPADAPLHKALEDALEEGVGHGSAWYGSQKEHWLGWLWGYSGGGAYGRQPATSAKDAAYVWTHIQCAPMLFWLAEALDMPDEDLRVAYDAVAAAGPNGATRCKVLRQVFPWSAIESALAIRFPQPWYRRFI